MKITFKSYHDNIDSCTELNIENKDNEIFLSISHNTALGEVISEAVTILNKHQLSELIGILLHLQSKIRK